MTSSIREIRLSLEDKLKERRDLLRQNYRLHHDLTEAKQQRDVALSALKSRHMNLVLEECADQIVNAILEKAIEASRMVSEQDFHGDLIVGISIPAVDIRYAVPQSYLKHLPNDEVQPDDFAYKSVHIDLARGRN
jgi:hypothetical protein